MLEHAKFITTHAPKNDVCPIFSKQVSAKKAVSEATLQITACGLYEAYINAHRVGDAYFTPGWTAYQHRIQVQTYDVTDLLGTENEIRIFLGKGWYASSISRGVYEPQAGPCSVIAALTMTYEDGTRETTVTDESWCYAESGIRYSDIYHGEIFDATVEPKEWKNAVVTEGRHELLIPQEGELVKQTEVIPAVNIFITPKGERVIDFGQEVTGYVCFPTVGKRGEHIVLDHAEVLDKDGNFYNENYRKAKSQVTYIANGNEDGFYHPIFSFQGFRYVRLTEYPTDELYVGDFSAIVVHSDMKRTGHFACSDPMVNRLYQNVIWGQRDNFLDVPTDCPQRDERLGWTGDAQVFCRTAAYNYRVDNFFRKWLHDLACGQLENGAVTWIVPSLDRNAGAFAWGDAATVCPWEMYRAYGDRRILAEQFDSMKKWCDYVYNKGDGPAAWGGEKQFGDWLGLDAEEGSYRGATNDLLLGTAFLAYSCDLVIKAGRVLGEDVASYEARKQEVKDAFAREFINEDGMLTCDTQTAYVIALQFDMVDDKATYASHLADLVRENGNKLKTGFIGTAYIMDALSDNGYADVAYSLLLQKEFPSWLYSVRKGATTIWEHWDGLKPDGSMWSSDMNSFNHYAYGAVASWLYGTVAGIRPDEDQPGYAHVHIKPIPDARLEWAAAELETAYGTIKSGWKKEKDGYRITVTIPSGSTADITIGDTVHTVSAGNYEYILK
ncbi:MAG: family 78 glycoside hydrolase catalytic domain [Clostridia bacterium]|nr:family 78 glycoside hydrolase catalytic domain [Clostridia bacterium]